MFRFKFDQREKGIYYNSRLFTALNNVTGITRAMVVVLVITKTSQATITTILFFGNDEGALQLLDPTGSIWLGTSVDYIDSQRLHQIWAFTIFPQ